MTLGEDNGCQLIYNGQAAIDRFPYGVFFRLVAPQLSIVQTFHWTRFGNVRIPLPVYQGQFGTLTRHPTRTGFPSSSHWQSTVFATRSWAWSPAEPLAVTKPCRWPLR